jgi:hypothetical protein
MFASLGDGIDRSEACLVWERRIFAADPTQVVEPAARGMGD